MIGLKLKIPQMLEGEVDGDLTDKQRNFIVSLSREVGASQLADNKELVNSLSKSQASAVLDQLMDVKRMLNDEMPVDASLFESGSDDQPDIQGSGSMNPMLIVVGIALIVLVIWLVS